jgi:ATP-binding cassette subfamily B protein
MTNWDKLIKEYNDMRYFDKHRAGDLMTRMSGDLEWCRHFVSFINYRILDSACLFLFTCLYLFSVSWKLTGLLIFVTPVLMLITKLYSSRVRPRFVAMRDRLSEMNAGAQENIAGNRVVKAFAREEYEKDKFREHNRAFRDANLDINERWLKFYPGIDILANAMTVITIF